MELQREWSQFEIQNSEDEISHRDDAEEKSFYQAVCSGDIDTVRQNCKEQRFNDNNGVGLLSRNPITNLKYHFVITAAIITRLCVENGMEMEQAYRLSDFYILKLDTIHTVKGILSIHDQMVLDYTGKMKLLQKNLGTTKPVTMCIEYIYTHIKERITIEDLAGHTGLSPSYLSRLFMLETGTSISIFIREKKIEKARNLLKFSDYSLIEIANYLSFSSQSHFTQLFKKYNGMTPKKYRDLNYRNNWNTK